MAGGTVSPDGCGSVIVKGGGLILGVGDNTNVSLDVMPDLDVTLKFQ